ncbi:MAG TPA: hypothetical protein VGN88_03245, partial [Phycisphaerae bacterium]
MELVARRCKAKIVGVQRVEYIQHGLLVRTAIEAFGEVSQATFFIEGLPPQGDIPRPDLILMHPEVGVLVIENKGISLEDIHDAHDTSLRLTRDGRLKDEDPFRQAERVMYRLRDLSSQRIDLADVLFLRTVAFPRIRRSEFERRFGVQLPIETLFSDACNDPKQFREQILEYANAGQRNAKKRAKLTPSAQAGIWIILSGRALFNPPRRTLIDNPNAELLGVQIQEMELTLKEPTQEQRDLGNSKLLGAHRLFRGVAGSGKSVMLALSVAQTLMTFVQERQNLFSSNAPSRRVLVVCFNKTLVHYLRAKIQDRYGRLAWDSPSDDVLLITHFEGLVRKIEAQAAAMATGLTWEQKEQRAKAMCAAFDKLDEETRDSLLFDAVYVDEAQDLIPAELELLRRLARKEKDGRQTLIIFYDNAQNIYGVMPPTWIDL